MLQVIKLLHTLVWAFFASCIIAIPYFSLRGELTQAWSLIALVALEVVILMANGMRCPMTVWAGRYTASRVANFDIYLPLYLARHNQRIFGALYALGLVLTIYQSFKTYTIG